MSFDLPDPPPMASLLSVWPSLYPTYPKLQPKILWPEAPSSHLLQCLPPKEQA